MTIKEAVKFLNKPVRCKLKRSCHEFPKGIYILREIRQRVKLINGERKWEHRVSVEDIKNDRVNYEINVSDIYPPEEQ